MGSVINFDNKCPRCGHNNLFSDYYYKTGEGVYSCNACGKNHLAFFKRDKTGAIVKKDVEYPIDGSLVMAVKAYRPDKEWYRGEIPYDNLPEDGAILWEMPITSDMTNKDIEDFLYPETEREYNSKDDIIGHEVLVERNPMYMDAFALEYGIKNLFYKENGEYKKLLYVGNGFRLGTDNDGQKRFVLKKAVWEIDDSGGYGVLSLWEKPDKNGTRNTIVIKYFEKAISLDEALGIWSRHMSVNLDTAESYLTIWNEPKKELVCIGGAIPETNYLLDENGNKHM